MLISVFGELVKIVKIDILLEKCVFNFLKVKTLLISI
jgi:hypothetical protein